MISNHALTNALTTVYLLCLAYMTMSCYFEHFNAGRKVLLISRVVTFIPLLFGVHFKQEKQSSSMVLQGKRYIPLRNCAKSV